MWVDFRRYSSVYCDIVISQYCGIVALFVTLLLSSHSGQILPPNTQIFTNFDWWRYLLLFLTLSPSNKSLWHGRHPADRCDNFLIFLHVGTGRGSQMSVSIIYSGAILREGGVAKNSRKNLSARQNCKFRCVSPTCSSKSPAVQKYALIFLNTWTFRSYQNNNITTCSTVMHSVCKLRTFFER